MVKQKIRVKLNSAGVRALLQSDEVAADLRSRGESIASALPTGNGEEWKVTNFIGKDRAQVLVKTGNTAAKKASAEDNVLIAGLSAGR